VKVSIKINGVSYERDVEPRTLLAYFLREDCGLTGAHIGCDTSSCGCCVVVLDGERAVKSCTMFAAQADGHEVLTVEDDDAAAAAGGVAADMRAGQAAVLTQEVREQRARLDVRLVSLPVDGHRDLHAFASWSARHTFSPLAGISTCVTPYGASASTTAL